jgi:hypothetical protein
MLGMWFGVKDRIYGGFAVLVVLGLALARFAVWQLSAIKTSVDRLGGIAGNNTRMLEVQRDVEVQRATLRFKYDGDEAALKIGTDAAANATDLFRQAEANASEARRSIYSGRQVSNDGPCCVTGASVRAVIGRAEFPHQLRAAALFHRTFSAQRL